MGTPDYIAPEQAMDARLSDIRSDLYSLGCTFYFLLTGRVPFPGGSVMEKLLKHQGQAPPAVTALRPEVPPAVAAVVHRLMAKSPAERYQAPAELVVALAAASAPAPVAVPVAAPPPAAAPVAVPAPADETFGDLRPDTVETGGSGSQWRRPETRRVLLLSLAGLLVVVVLLVVLVLLNRGKERQASPGERPAPQPPAPAADKETEAAWAALRARGEAAGADRGKFREELLAFRREHPGTRQAAEAAGLLPRLPSPLDGLAPRLTAEQHLAGQPREVVAVFGDHRAWMGLVPSGGPVAAYSPDGRWLACAAFADRSVRLLDPNTLLVRAALTSDAPQRWVDFRSDGRALATAGLAGVEIWDLSGPRPVRTRMLNDFPGRVSSAVWSPDGKRLAVVVDSDPPTVRLYDLSGAGPKVWAVLKGHTESICAPAFSPDGTTLVTGSRDKTIRVYDLTGAQHGVRAVLKNHTYWVVWLAFSPDGRRLASSGQHDYTVRLWDMTAPEPKELAGPWQGDATDQVAFSPDGKRLAAGFWASEWRLWDVSKDQLNPVAAVKDHAELTWGVTWSPDGKTLATTGNDGTVHLWDVSALPPRQRRVGPGHAQAVTGLSFAADDRTLASFSADGTVRLWDCVARRPPVVLPVRVGHGTGAFSPDGQTVAAADAGNRVVFFDAAGGQPGRPGCPHDQPVTALAYSPDGTTLVTAGADSLVKWWDVAGGEPRQVQRLGQPPGAVAFSPDGKLVAVAEGKGLLRVWGGDGRQLQATGSGEVGNLLALAFSPDGKVLASGGSDGHVRLWDAATGKARGDFAGHERPARFVAFSPDGKELVSAGLDGRVIVRDAATGREQRTLTLPLPVYAAALAGDGRHLATGHADGTTYVLRLSPPPGGQAP
jgi:WD40 repeat protein